MKTKKTLTAWTKATNLIGSTLEGIIEMQLQLISWENVHDGTGSHPIVTAVAPDGTTQFIPENLLFSTKELSLEYDIQKSWKRFSSSVKKTFFINKQGNKTQVNAMLETLTLDDECMDRKGTIRIESSDNMEVCSYEDYTWYTDEHDYDKLETTLYTYEDGHTETLGGEFRKFIIPEDKKKLLEKLKKAVLACQNAGIKLNYDIEDGDIYAYYDPQDTAHNGEAYNDSANFIPTRVFTSVVSIDLTNCDWAPVLRNAE